MRIKNITIAVAAATMAAGLAGCNDGHDTPVEKTEGRTVLVDVGMPSAAGPRSFPMQRSVDVNELSECQKSYMQQKLGELTTEAFSGVYYVNTKPKTMNIKIVANKGAGRYQVEAVVPAAAKGAVVLSIQTPWGVLKSIGEGSESSPAKANIVTTVTADMLANSELDQSLLIKKANEICEVLPLVDVDLTNIDNISSVVDQINEYVKPLNASEYTVSGSIAGISDPVTLLLGANGLSDSFLPARAKIRVYADGSFSFPQKLKNGGRFNVAVLGENDCDVTNGAGVVSGDVSNIVIDCSVDRVDPEPEDYLIDNVNFGDNASAISDILTQINEPDGAVAQARALGLDAKDRFEGLQILTDEAINSLKRAAFEAAGGVGEFTGFSYTNGEKSYSATSGSTRVVSIETVTNTIWGPMISFSTKSYADFAGLKNGGAATFDITLNEAAIDAEFLPIAFALESGESCSGTYLVTGLGPYVMTISCGTTGINVSSESIRVNDAEWSIALNNSGELIGASSTSISYSRASAKIYGSDGLVVSVENIDGELFAASFIIDHDIDGTADSDDEDDDNDGVADGEDAEPLNYEAQ